MKAYILFYLFTLFLVKPVSVYADNKVPVTFRATYKLYLSGLEIAESTREVRKISNTQFNYRSESHTTGLAALLHKDHVIENSSWHLVDDKIIPIEYSYIRTKGKKNRNISIHFDWDNKILVNQINNDNLQFPLTDGILDKLSYQYAIMHDLRNNQFQTHYTVADARKIKTYHLERAGEETITTSIGELLTIRINKIDDDTRLSFWCAPQFKYLPVRIEQVEEDGKVISTEIQKIEGL